MRVPKDFPVKVLNWRDEAKDRVTCGVCKRSWDDAIPTAYTPAPAARCPFEEFHPPHKQTTEEFIEEKRKQYRQTIVEWQEECLRIRKLARELFDHLEYVNWGGNAYEREVSEKLRKKAREEFEK